MLDLLEFSLAAAIRPWTFGGAEGRGEEPEEQAQLCTAPGPGESHKQSLGGRDGGIGGENECQHFLSAGPALL